MTVPGKAERRIALRLAAVLAAAAVLTAEPVITTHPNLLSAPHWALAAAVLAVIQLVFAGWMLNAPDWATARAQMAVCAVVTTIYGMLMTLTMTSHHLILGLEEVRRSARPGAGQCSP